MESRRINYPDVPESKALPVEISPKPKKKCQSEKIEDPHKTEPRPEIRRHGVLYMCQCMSEVDLQERVQEEEKESKYAKQSIQVEYLVLSGKPTNHVGAYDDATQHYWEYKPMACFWHCYNKNAGYAGNNDERRENHRNRLVVIRAVHGVVFLLLKLLIERTHSMSASSTCAVKPITEA